MKQYHNVVSLVVVCLLGGCISIKPGDKETEVALKELRPIAGKTSLYVCREQGLLASGNRTIAIVDGTPIGTLKPGNFAHTVVEPGNHDVYVNRLGSNSGTLKISTKSGEIAYVWVGVTGKGFGALTVDNFPTQREAEECVRSAEYVVLFEQ